MTFSDWFINNWIDLARLLVQCGIFAAIIWYGRNVLKTLRASQEQIGALLRLSVSEGAAHEASSIAEPALAPPGFATPAPIEAPKHEVSLEAMPAYASNSMRMASHVPEREQSLGGRIATERAAVKDPEPMQAAEIPSLTPWVAAPAVQDSERTEGLAARIADSRRNLGRWLKEPPRHSTSGVNPFRRMIRWLQAPAGH